MKKISLILLAFIQLAFSATPEQVEQYIMVSKADRDLVEMEQMIEEMIPSNSTKSVETVGIRFNEYLAKNFSEKEMTELIKLYKNPLLLTLREIDSELPEEELNEFNLSLQENPLSTERLYLNKKILENMFDDENIKNMLNGLETKMVKLLGQTKETKAITQEDEKSFLNEIREELKLPLLYSTQTLSIEELTELQKLTNTAIIRKANKVELDATMYAIEIFLQDMINGMMNSFIPEQEGSLLNKFLEE